ncbi:MAG: HPr-rel-A system PqqD family peptide chaperone [Pseudomonadota bacterium]
MPWQLATPGEFYDPGETAVIYFDPDSGDTHLISDFAAHILRSMGSDPVELEALVMAVATDVDVEDTTDLARGVTAVLKELQALSLISEVA